jgi:hypothetical protein
LGLFLGDREEAGRVDPRWAFAAKGEIEATEEPRSHLAKLFEVEVVPPADDEGL